MYVSLCFAAAQELSQLPTSISTSSIRRIASCIFLRRTSFVGIVSGTVSGMASLNTTRDVLSSLVMNS
jgi:hypothetical protein